LVLFDHRGTIVTIHETEFSEILNVALRVDPADCSTGRETREKRPSYIRHVAVLEPDGEGSFEVVAEHVRFRV
jgi:hypothetical protein